MLNDEIAAYLRQNNIQYAIGDYATASEKGVDGVVKWDEAKLGPQPSQADLDTAYAAAQVEAIKAENKTQAMALLQATDWVEMPSVSDPSSSPRLLNRADFIAYRVALRAIAVSPPSDPATLPDAPSEQWGG
jgi:hypothetical protein